MAEENLFPSLSPDGWVNTPIKKADYILSHFFLSDYSQTSCFPGKVKSFSFLVQKHQNEVNELATELQTVLSEYFSNYFNNVEVEITSISDATSINIKNLTLYLAFSDATGNQINLSRLIKYADMRAVEIIATNNNG